MLPNHKWLGALCMVLLLFAGLESHAQSGSPTCAPLPDASNALGKMCVVLQVHNGRIVATDSNTAFWIPPAFTSTLSPKLTLNWVEAALRNQLDKILGDLQMPYQAAFAPGEADNALLNDAATNALRTLNGSLAEYAQKMQPWSDSNPARGQPADVLVDSSNFFVPMVAAASSSSLSYDLELSSLDRSLAVFRFPPPFHSRSVMLQLPNSSSPKQQTRIRELRKALSSLDGTLWDRSAIEGRLNAYYARLGLAAQAVVLNAGLNTVMINDAPRIARILLADPDVTGHDVDKVLWILLSQHDFRVAMKHRPVLKAGQRTVDYVTDLGYAAGDEPYALPSRLQSQQLQLSQIGFSASLVPDTSRSGTTQIYQDLQIQKPASTPPAESTTPKPAPPSIDPHGQIGAPAIPSQPSSGKPPPSPTVPAHDKLWYVGGGGTYRPGQVFSVFGLIQRSRLQFPFQDGSISGQIGYPAGAVQSLNYAADYLGFERLHQRLSLRLTGSNDVAIHRFLFGQKVDEHRPGGFGQLQWEPFHDLGGQVLQITGEMRRATVTVSNNVANLLKLNLSTFRTSAAYQFSTELVEYPCTIKIEPFVETGLGLSHTESTFAAGGITANYHQMLGTFAYDAAARYQDSTGNTPIVEQPSFGGGDVVRGFRADDAIGRRLWSLQNEVWLPIPGIRGNTPASASANQVASILAKLKLAPFIDVGGAYQTTLSAPGLRSGTGLGLRLDMDRILFKLDWGHGFGAAATGSTAGKFYFTLVSNLPF